MTEGFIMSIVNMDNRDGNAAGGGGHNDTGPKTDEASITPAMLQTCLQIGHMQHFAVLLAFVRLDGDPDSDEAITARLLLDKTENILAQRHDRKGIYNSLATLRDVGIVRRYECEHGEHRHCYRLTDHGEGFVRVFGMDDIAGRIEESDRLARQDLADIKEFCK